MALGAGARETAAAGDVGDKVPGAWGRLLVVLAGWGACGVVLVRVDVGAHVWGGTASAHADFELLVVVVVGRHFWAGVVRLESSARLLDFW